MSGWRGLALAAAFWAAMPGTAATADECHLRVGWEPYGVYTFRNPDGDLVGADIDLVKANAEEAGCKVSFHEMPWVRILLALQKGTLEVATSASWTEERNRFAYYSKTYRYAEMAVFVRRGEVDRYPINSLADIRGIDFTLGVIVGYHYNDEVDELMKDPAFAARIDGAVDYRTNIRKLVHGRLDGYLAEDVNVMIAEANILGLGEKVERHPMPVSGDQLHLMFSRKTVDPAIVSKMDAAIVEMRGDGRLQAMIDKYLK